MIIVYNQKRIHDPALLRGDCNVEGFGENKANITFNVSNELTMFIIYLLRNQAKINYSVCSKCIDWESFPEKIEKETMISDFPLDIIPSSFDRIIYPRFSPSEETIENYFEAIINGEEMPPITIGVYDDGEELNIILLDGYHRLKAYEKFYKVFYENEKIFRTIKARIIRIDDKKELFLYSVKENLKHGLPLKKEEKISYAKKMYENGFEIKEIAKILNLSEKTIYNWFGNEIKQKKNEIKEIAKELYQEGKTQMEIAKELKIPQQTISYWLNDKKFKEIANEQIEIKAWNKEKIDKSRAYINKIYELLLEAGILYEKLRDEENVPITFKEIFDIFYNLDDIATIEKLYKIIAILDYLRTSEPFNRRLRIKFLSIEKIKSANKIDLKGIINNGF